MSFERIRWFYQAKLDRLLVVAQLQYRVDLKLERKKEKRERERWKIRDFYKEKIMLNI